MASLTARFGPFLPDLATEGSAGSREIKNVVPVLGGYAPVRQISPLTEALEVPALAARFVLASDRSALGFVATDDQILRLSGTTFSNVSRDEGYNTSEDNSWDFSLIGDTLFASNFDDPIQQFDLRVDAQFRDIDAEAPQSKYIRPVQNFFALAHINTEGVVERSGVRWSSNNNPLNFPEVGSTEAVQTLSGRQILATDYGDITGLSAGLVSSDALVFQERALQRMNFVQGRAVFAFDVIEGARGCNVPNSIVQVGGTVFYFAENGIYNTDGQRSNAVGNSKVDSFLYDNIDTSRLDLVRSSADIRNKLVYWAFPSIGSDVADLVLVLNYDINEWSYIDGLQIQTFARTLATGVTLEDLDAVSSSLDDLPASLDSDLWKGGGLPVFSAVNQDNRLGGFDGDTLETTLRTSEIRPAEDNRTYLQFSRPLVDTSAASVRPLFRETTQEAVRRGTSVETSAAGRCRHRRTAYYFALEMVIPAGTDWTFAQGVDAVYEAAGVNQPLAATDSGTTTDIALMTTGSQFLTSLGQRVLLSEQVLNVVEEVDVLALSNGDVLITSDGDRIALS